MEVRHGCGGRQGGGGYGALEKVWYLCGGRNVLWKRMWDCNLVHNVSSQMQPEPDLIYFLLAIT